MSASFDAVAEQELMLSAPGGGGDPILIDRTRRVIHLILELIRQPELHNVSCDRRAAELAATFYEIGRARSVRSGRLQRETVLLEPYDDECREAAIDAFQSLSGQIESMSESAHDAIVAALRQWNWSNNASPEAVLLAEAVNLDDVGPMWIWYQAQRFGYEGQSIKTLISQWRVRQEYGYWETRIRESLRFEWSRKLARRRVAAMQVFMESIEAQVGG